MTRTALATLLLVLLPASPAPAQPSRDVRAATEIVMQQLDAFRRNDFDAAYTHASATIREMFTREGFEHMVRRGYPEIARSVSAFVADARVVANGNVYLSVRVRGANGKRIEALYEMVWEDGRWRINGVVAGPDPSEPA